MSYRDVSSKAHCIGEGDALVAFIFLRLFPDTVNVGIAFVSQTTMHHCTADSWEEIINRLGTFAKPL